MKLEKCIAIHRPVEIVFAFVTNMSNVTRWTPAKSIRQLSGGPLDIGSTYLQVVELLGQKVELTTQITEYEPHHLFAFKTVSGPIPLSNRFIFTPVEGGTQLTIVGEGEPGHFMKLAGPLMYSMLRKQVETQLSLLKNLLEAEE